MKKIFLIFTVLFTCALPVSGFGDTDTKTRNTLLSKAYSKYCDDEGYTPSHPTTALGERYAAKPTIDCSGEKGKVTLNCYKIKDIQQSLNQEDLKHFCSPDKITNFTIKTVTRPSTHIRDCKAKEKNAINATACKISADGKYSNIECDNQKGYWLNATSTACEKSGRQETNKKCTSDQLNQLNAKSGKLYYYAETPNTQYCGITKCNDNFVIDNSQQQEKCVCPTTNNEFELKDGKCVKKSDVPNKTNKSTKSELIKISGIVIDETSQDEQTIGGVRITYDEGKKDKEGNKKYARHQTGNNGRFAINIVPGSTITFTHKMYQETTTTPYSVETKDVKIEMSPTAETVKDRNQQELCEKDKKGTWNKTKKECNCKDKTATFDETSGCVPAEEFKFEGVVQDKNSTPIPDVKVKYGNQSTTTDAQGKFTLNAPKDTEITFSYKGYKNYTHKLTANAENQTIIMDPTDKAANNAKKKKLCEAEGPNKGKWNEAFKTCNCKDKTFFDEDKGCIESTQEYIDAEGALNNLYEQFTEQLETIKNGNAS